MIRKHFIVSGKQKPDYVINYYASEKVPFNGGVTQQDLFMKRDNNNNKVFDVVDDKYEESTGYWGLKFHDSYEPNAYYGDIMTLNGDTGYADYGGPEYNYSNLITGIVFPEGIEHIYGSILENIDSQTSCTDITLPTSVKYLTGNLFGNYDVLTSITIPYNVVRVDNLCSVSSNSTHTNNALLEIVFQSEMPPDASFSSDHHPLGIYNPTYTKENFKIKVYADAINNYKADNIWKLYSDLYDTIDAICYVTTDGNEITMPAYSAVSNTKQDYIGTRWVLGTNKIVSFPAWFSRESTLQKIALPNIVTSIIQGAFQACSSLTSIIIQNSVTNIGQEAFSGCSSLASVTIPESVTSIGKRAFQYCSSLTSVIWNAKNYADLTYSPFSDISSQITSFTFGKNVEHIPAYLCAGMDKVISMTIPNSVTSIGNSAFYNCKALTSITIPNSVTSIGGSAFLCCDKLTKTNYTGDIAGWCNIKFANDLSNPMWYSHNLFINNQEIKDLVIPDSVTSIGDWAFFYCHSLTSITIPNSVTSIGEEAFVGCSSLTSITIPNSVTSIGERAFSDCSSITSIVIPDSMTSIGWGAFEDCSSLTSITIPNSVTSIGERTFKDCCSLTSINIPDDVTNIGLEAFYGCESLTSITIPDSVTSIGKEAFSDCDLLTSINVDPNNSNYCSVNGVLFNKEQTVVISYPNNKSNTYVIPDGVTNIEYGAFSYCSNLISITIPESVTSIGPYAFYYCNNLNNFVFTGTILQWNSITPQLDRFRYMKTTFVQCTDGQVLLT